MGLWSGQRSGWFLEGTNSHHHAPQTFAWSHMHCHDFSYMMDRATVLPLPLFAMVDHVTTSTMVMVPIHSCSPDTRPKRCTAVAAAKSLQSCPTLCDPTDGSPPGSSLSLGFSRQEHWSGLPFPSPKEMHRIIQTPTPITGTKSSQTNWIKEPRFPAERCNDVFQGKQAHQGANALTRA